MCRHPGAVSPAKGPVPAWYPYYYYLCYVQASWDCLADERPGACLVPLLLLSLLCAGILGLSRRRKAWCLLGTPTTSILLCAGILGLSRRRKARCLLVCCLLGTPTLLLYMLVNTEFQHPLFDEGIQINTNTNVNLIIF
jgi:hypothetical protein